MDILDRFLYKVLSRMVDMIVMAILAALVIDVFINVCFRYVLDLPLAWSDELATILLVWVTFLGGVCAIRRGRHLQVEDLLKRMEGGGKRWASRLIHVAVSLFLVFLIWKGFALALSPEIKNQMTDALEVTNAILYLPLPIGGVLMLPYSLRNLIHGGERGRER